MTGGINAACRSPYGERGLKFDYLEPIGLVIRRSPYGERGLKSRPRDHHLLGVRSLSLRRAWIEIMPDGIYLPTSSGRSPYGERGLKFGFGGNIVKWASRSPYGERGLKYNILRQPSTCPQVALLTESVD